MYIRILQALWKDHPPPTRDEPCERFGPDEGGSTGMRVRDWGPGAGADADADADDLVLV